MAITPLPTPPSRTTPSTFSTLADAFLGALPTFVTEANAQAAALTLNDTTDSSASSVAIGKGAKTFTVTAAKSFQPGMTLTIADTAAPSTNWMHGTVTSYSGTTLVMNITHILGSGTKSAWTISFSAPIQSLGSLAEAINTAYVTVASHATTSAIWAAAGNIINFTGTETITDFPAADQAGSQRMLICAGACTFTHAGDITVQGGATYTSSAGDMVLVTATSTTTFKINIFRQTETGTGSAVMATSPTIATPTTTGDVTGDGSYLLDYQNFPDMLSNGPGYWFDGDNDKITVGSGTEDNFIMDNDFSIVSFANANNLTGWHYLASFGTSSSGNQISLALDSDYLAVSGYSNPIVSDTSLPIPINENFVGTASYSNSSEEIIFYLNGKPGDTLSGKLQSTVGKGFVGVNTADNSSFSGQIFRTLLFNLALTAAEVKAFSNGAAIPYKYIGASQTELVTSQTDRDFSGASNWANNNMATYDETGDLSVTWNANGQYSRLVGGVSIKKGKRYRIAVDVANLTGTANIREYSGTGVMLVLTDGTQVTGEFTATVDETSFIVISSSTTGGVDLDNFTLTQIGCVLDLNPSGITPTQWLDNSGNSLNGTVSGALVTNRPVQKVVQQNLLTNSGFEIWSNSTLLEATSGAAPVTDGANAALVNNLLTNGGFDSDTTGWTAERSPLLSSDAGGKTGNNLTITENGGNNNPYAWQAVTTEIGKLYQLNVYIKAGTEATYLIGIGGLATGGQEIYSSTGEAAADWTTTVINKVFEATTTTTYISLFQLASTASGTTLLFDSVTLYEVTPGCIAADSLGPDGWGKANTALDLYREHSGSNTKIGSFYSLKMVASTTHMNAYFPTYNTIDSWYSKFRGRTVTFGAWVKTSTADKALLKIYDTAGNTESSKHTGSGNFEWLEVTRTISDTTTTFYIMLTAGESNTAYISQPTLIFGSHIGEGNTARPSGEIVTAEKIIPLTNYISSAVPAAATVNLETETDGKIGKGVKRVHGWYEGTNSAAAKYIDILSSATGVRGARLYSQVNAQIAAIPFSTNLDSNGDFYIYPEDANWTTVRIQISALELR